MRITVNNHDNVHRTDYIPHRTVQRKRRWYAIVVDHVHRENIFAAGFSALTMLRKNFEVHIYAHCGGKEALGRAPGQGVSPEAVAKLARLMGAEFFRSNILGGYLVGGTNEEIESLINTMRAPMKGIKDLVPALSGGLSPKNIGDNLRAFGTGFMALAGSGITQYPGGIAAGVEAMKAAATAAIGEKR